MKNYDATFMAQTSALIALVQPVLHRVSCSNENFPNAPKYYETQQNRSLGSNGVDQLCSLRKNPMLFRHELHQFSPFCTKLRAVTKQSKMHPNTMKRTKYMSLGFNGVDRVRSLQKILMRLRGTNFCTKCTSSTHFAVMKQSKMHPNTVGRTKT